MKYLVLCPRCPKLAKIATGSLKAALEAGGAEEANHIACGGEVWISRTQADHLKSGSPVIYRPSGEVLAWKDVEPPPLIAYNPSGEVSRIRFPVDGSLIVETGQPIGLN